MKKINICILILTAVILTHGTAVSSDMKEKNKKARAAQEEIYKLTDEFKSHKREIHLQRDEERRRKQYRKEVERKKN